MALLGNFTVKNKCPVRFLAGSTASTETGGRARVQRNGSERNRFYIDRETTANKTWAEPSANYPPASFTIIPQKGSWLSSRRETWTTFTATATGVHGMPGEGSASFSITVPDVSGQLITSGEGSASFSITTNTPLLTASVNGEGSASFSITTNTPVLGAEASLEASASFSFTAGADILPLDDTSPLRTASASFAFTGSLTSYALGHMEGSTIVASEVPTPEQNAAAVWGSKLNSEVSAAEAVLAAGSAGDPWISMIDGMTAGDMLALVRTLSTEIHRLNGLEQGTPVVHTPDTITVGDISISLTGDNITTRTVERIE